MLSRHEVEYLFSVHEPFHEQQYGIKVTLLHNVAFVKFPHFRPSVLIEDAFVTQRAVPLRLAL